MSTTLDIPSSSGIVIVDNTSNSENILTAVQVQAHENLPIHHIQQQSQQHQHASVVGNEICSINTGDDYGNISASGIDAQSATLQSGVINFTSNDVLNNTQIFKFVSDDNTTILEPSSEEIQNYCNTGRINPGSKVHVISNIPFNPNKQHGQPSINLVGNGKNLPTNLNFVNAYITKSSLNTRKILNIPVKSQHSPATANQMQPQIGSAKTTTSNQLIQKVVPRNVQFVTRTSNAISNNNGNNNILMSRGGNIGSVQPSNTVIQSKGGASHQQVLMPQSSNIKATISQHGNVKNNTKTHVQSVKIFQGAQNKSSTGDIPSSSNQGGMKTVISNQSQKMTTIKTSSNTLGQHKYIKQFCNVTNNTTLASQQYSQHQIQQKNLSHQTNLIYSTNHNNNNNANTNNNNNTNSSGKVQTVHYQRSTNSINNVLIPGGKIVPKGTKYVVQNPNQTIVLPSSNSSNIMSVSGTSSGTNIHQIKLSGSQQFSNTTGGGTIKYVNAQGNVIQPPTKVRAIFQQTSSPNQQQHPQHQQSLIYNDGSIHQTDLSASQSNSSSIDELSVNETIMADEMSARILQSLSQQKVICSNNRQYNTQQQHHQIQSHNTIQKMYQAAAGTSSTTHKMFLASNDSGHFGSAASSHVRDERCERYFKVR